VDTEVLTILKWLILSPLNSCAFHEFRRKRVLEDAEQGLAVKQKQKQVAEDRKGSKSC